MAQKISDHESPELLFMKELEEALIRERLELSDEARVYLTRLLSVIRAEDAPRTHEALAPNLLKALNTVEPRQRALLLKGVGSSALLLCGWWWQFVEYMREYYRGADQSYHEDIGIQAFRHLEEMWFQELADKFLGIVDVLARMSGKLQVHSNEELLRAYEHWLKTHNKNAEKVLLAHGLLIPRIDDVEH